MKGEMKKREGLYLLGFEVMKGEMSLFLKKILFIRGCSCFQAKGGTYLEAGLSDIPNVGILYSQGGNTMFPRWE